MLATATEMGWPSDHKDRSSHGVSWWLLGLILVGPWLNFFPGSELKIVQGWPRVFACFLCSLGAEFHRNKL